MKRKCLILKDLQGALAGYFLQEDGKLVFKSRQGKMDGWRMICIDSYGREHALTVKGELDEIPFSEPQTQIEKVYGLKEGELILVSGEDARRAYETGKTAGKREAHESAACITERSIQNNPPEQEASADLIRQIAQARWPPPPCMTGARYRHGSWKLMDNGRTTRR